MRRVREACAVEARGGAERIISDVLLAEHKQWIARLEQEGNAQFLPSPEEEEELLREMQLSVGEQKKAVDVVPNLSPHADGAGSGYEDQMMLEEYLEAEAYQVEQYEHSLEHYLAQGEDTPMME